MTDIENARQLFRDSGLAFPTIPEKLAKGLKKQGEWLFSTRDIDVSPYNLDHYVREVEGTHVEDYAILAHSGHGANSYAIQYYLVYGALRLFLHLGWGGAYMDAAADSAKIRECFALADEIVSAAQNEAKLEAGGRLTIVGSDFYGSFWSAPEVNQRTYDAKSQSLLKALREVLHWLGGTNPLV